MANVRIGHASIDENRQAQKGTAGDQTGKEVCIRSWYLNAKGWVVLRAIDSAAREKIAVAMERACANPQIGYDQWQRDTLWNNVKGKGWDPAQTSKNVETDCSALVRVCIAYAFGRDVAGNIRTINEPDTLVATGLFQRITADKICRTSDYLLRGDILCTPVSGHTVVVLDNGPKAIVDKLTVDGKWGSDTTRALQRIFGTTVDGKISNQHLEYKAANPGLTTGWGWDKKPNGKGSDLIRKMQAWAGMPEKKRDGEWGPNTCKAIQKKLGTKQDGKVSKPSNMVRALQRWANEQA